MRQTEFIAATFDGVQTTFDTTVDYKPDTLVIFSTLLLAATEITENGGTSFTLATAPQDGDVMLALYRV